MSADAFANAAKNARQDCPKCHGTGMYKDSTVGTPHFTICYLCCRHDMGWWLLEKHYGADNGKWCCRAGCGLTVDTPPNEQKRRAIRVEDLTDEEMAAIEQARVPPEHDYDYADDPDPPA